MKNYFKAIFGNKTDYPLEYRFIIISSFAGMILSFLTAVFNCLLGLDPIIIIASFVVGGVAFGTYFTAKYKNMYKLSALIAISILTCLFYPLLWFYNGGSIGSIPYFIMFNAVLIAIFFNQGKYLYVFIVQILIVLLLFYIEFSHPELITPYETRTVKYLDQSFAFVLIFIICFFTIRRVMISYHQKINELEKAHEDLKIMASTDPLTGLLNRRKMYEKLEHETEKFKRDNSNFILAIGDLDDFKYFNDQYGHDCGDFILIEIANILKTNLKEEIAIARWGGEEFLILLKNSDLNVAENIIDDIRKKIENYDFNFGGNNLKISMTFGISDFKNSKDINICIKKADNALYQGKENGKNCIISN